MGSTCWVLTLSNRDLHFVHACQIVALESPRTWLSRSLTWIPKESRRQKLWLWSYPVFALSSVGFLVIAPWFLLARSSSNSHLLEETPRRISMLRDRWSLFSSGMLAEYQSVNSARDCSIAPEPGNA